MGKFNLSVCATISCTATAYQGGQTFHTGASSLFHSSGVLGATSVRARRGNCIGKTGNASYQKESSQSNLFMSSAVIAGVARIASVCKAARHRSFRTGTLSNMPRRQSRQDTRQPTATGTELEPIQEPFDPAKQLGVTAPLGFFDPLGITQDMDERDFRNLRASELKHGRIAMLAATGLVVQHFIAIPGFEDVPRGLGAVGVAPASIGLFLVAAVSGYMEVFVWRDTEEPNSQGGDFGNPLCPVIEGMSLVTVTDELRNKEINNGRFAMIAVMGILGAELATGLDGVDQISAALTQFLAFFPPDFFPAMPILPSLELPSVELPSLELPGMPAGMPELQLPSMPELPSLSMPEVQLPGMPELPGSAPTAATVAEHATTAATVAKSATTTAATVAANAATAATVAESATTAATVAENATTVATLAEKATAY